MVFETVTIGDATLYCADCREVLPTLPKVDLVLTDPPYGIGADKNLRANKKHGNAAAPSKDYGRLDWDSEPPKLWVIELIRDKSKSQILWGGNYFNLPPASGWLVWDKENGDNGYADCELAWTNLQQAIRRIKWRWAGMLQQDMANKESREHPTQKPVAVMQWALLQASDSTTVLDPFMGSGTTGVACANLGKTFIGIERERKYFDIACERIARAYEQPRLFADKPEPPKQEALL